MFLDFDTQVLACKADIEVFEFFESGKPPVLIHSSCSKFTEYSPEGIPHSLVVLVPEGHAVVDQPSARWSALDGQRWILPPPHRPHRTWFESMMSAGGLVWSEASTS